MSKISFMDAFIQTANYKNTENGALAYESTLNPVYDLFAFGGAYRNRTDDDIRLLFKNAFETDAKLALKCLFYLRDVREGQGERRFFRVAYKWLIDNRPAIAATYINNIADFGRWDDLIHICENTILESKMIKIVKGQLIEDLMVEHPSLLAKWLPSENASSRNTKELGGKIRTALRMTHKDYRKTLSILREKIRIVEKLMSEQRWEEIEFDKLPSKAGLNYKNAFARNEIIGDKYKAFISNKNTKVNAAALYPYDIVNKALYCNFNDTVDREAIQKYWDNQKDYFNGKESKIMCVVDTSGSMTCGRPRPIDVAISLGFYCAEKNKGDFHNKFITYSSNPQLVEIKGLDFVDKVNRIYRNSIVDDTDLLKVFKLLRTMGEHCDPNTMPETLLVISDMEINYGACECGLTEMETERLEWNKLGLKMPKIVYWNVNARNNTILEKGSGISLVSGCSPVLIEQILQGVSGYDLMMQKLNSDRYKKIGE